MTFGISVLTSLPCCVWYWPLSDFKTFEIFWWVSFDGVTWWCHSCACVRVWWRAGRMTAGTVVITGGILATVILLCIIAVLCYCRLQVWLSIQHYVSVYTFIHIFAHSAVVFIPSFLFLQFCSSFHMKLFNSCMLIIWETDLTLYVVFFLNLFWESTPR